MSGARFRGLSKRTHGAFERIATGDDSCIHPRTAEALLRRGLIAVREEDVVSGIRGVRLTLRRYEVPIPVHMEWCAWCAAIKTKEDKINEQETPESLPDCPECGHVMFRNSTSGGFRCSYNPNHRVISAPSRIPG